MDTLTVLFSGVPGIFVHIVGRFDYPIMLRFLTSFFYLCSIFVNYNHFINIIPK